MLLGQAHDKLGDVAEASKAYGQCASNTRLTSGPGHEHKRGMSAHAWGRVLLGGGQLQQAEQVARTAVARYPGLWQARDLHVVALASLGRKNDAWAALKAASVDLVPGLE